LKSSLMAAFFVSGLLVNNKIYPFCSV